MLTCLVWAITDTWTRPCFQTKTLFLCILHKKWIIVMAYPKIEIETRIRRGKWIKCVQIFRGGNQILDWAYLCDTPETYQDAHADIFKIHPLVGTPYSNSYHMEYQLTKYFCVMNLQISQVLQALRIHIGECIFWISSQSVKSLQRNGSLKVLLIGLSKIMIVFKYIMMIICSQHIERNWLQMNTIWYKYDYNILWGPYLIIIIPIYSFCLVQEKWLSFTCCL